VALPEHIDTSLGFDDAKGSLAEWGPQLAEHYYNATITYFDRLTDEVWIFGVKPDDGPVSFVPGTYASLGLGYWEPRCDDALEADIDTKWSKLVRRSYSVSTPMFTSDDYHADHGTADLARCEGLDDIEIYAVLVRPEDDFVPGLTPRLALKDVGDRLFMGRKMAGRYTAEAVTDPTTPLVFLSTGTGEAPNLAMIVELLRTGHTGPIVSVVTARHWSDLVYHDKNLALAKRFANYTHLAIPTREPDVEKRYIQDVVRTEFTPERLGVELDPAKVHVFVCGNPDMIGLPDESGDEPVYPETTGVVELLVERGFKLDKRRDPGNIHFEEFW
jgi:ferredoxin--NADP+ reductase